MQQSARPRTAPRPKSGAISWRQLSCLTNPILLVAVSIFSQLGESALGFGMSRTFIPLLRHKAKWKAASTIPADSNRLLTTASRKILSRSEQWVGCMHDRGATIRNWSEAPKPAHSETPVLDPLVVCGPSGVGKGTIIEHFMRECEWAEKLFAFGVSHTTRPPRRGEVNGKHYFFVDMELMKSLIDNDYFVESAQVHGNYYGTSWQAIRSVQAMGKKCLLDIDVQGVQRIKRLVELSAEVKPDANVRFHPKYIFIAPPSIDVLEARLLGRGSESEETLRRRIGNARSEVEYGMKPGNFDRIVVNANLNESILEFERAVMELYGL